MYASEYNNRQFTGSSSSMVGVGSTGSTLMYPFSFVRNQSQEVPGIQFAGGSSSATEHPHSFPGNRMNAVPPAAEPLNGLDNAGANTLDPIQSAHYQTVLNPSHAIHDQTTNVFQGRANLNPIPSNNPVEVIEKTWLKLDEEDFESQLQTCVTKKPNEMKKVLYRRKDSESDICFVHVGFKLQLIDIDMIGFTKDDLDIQIATVVTKNNGGFPDYYPTEEGATLDKSKDFSVEGVNIVIKNWKAQFKLLNNSQRSLHSQHCKVSWKITVTGKYQHPLNRNDQKRKCVLMTEGIECPNIRNNQPDRNKSRMPKKKRRLPGDADNEQEYTVDSRALTDSENPTVQSSIAGNQTTDARVDLGQHMEETPPLGGRDVLTPTTTAGFNAANGIGSLLERVDLGQLMEQTLGGRDVLTPTTTTAGFNDANGIGSLLNEPTNQIARVANHWEGQVVRRSPQDSMVDAASDNSVDRIVSAFLKLGINGPPEDEKANRLRYCVSHYWNNDEDSRYRKEIFEEIISSLKTTEKMDQVFGKPDDRNDRNSETPIMNAVHARNTKAAIRMIKCLPVELQREHLMKVTGSNSTIIYIACAKTNLEFLTWFNDNHRSILKCPEDMQTLLLKKNNDSRFPRSITESAYKNKQAKKAKGNMDPREYFKRCDDVYDLIEEWKRIYGVVDDIEPSMSVA